MNQSTPEAHVRVADVDDKEWLFFPSIVPDVAIIRATTSDENGNLTFEEEGSPLGALDQAYAAHNNGGIVIAQVRRLAEGHSLHPQQVRVPGILVDVVVVAPDQLQTTQTQNDPTISGQIKSPTSRLPHVDFTLEKVIARRAAQELQAGEIVNLGFGVSALVPHILVEEGLAREVSWVLEQGAVGGVPLLDFAFGCAQNPDALMQSADQFTLLQGGGFHRSMLSFLQVDRHGNVNVNFLPGKRHVTAGVGGFADITSSAPEIAFIGSFTAGRRDISFDGGQLDIRADGATKFVNDVASVTFSGEQAIKRGQRVRYITERCVMELTAQGLVITEIAPGVDLDRDILAHSEFDIPVSPGVRLMDANLFDQAKIGLELRRLALSSRLTPTVSTTALAPELA